MAASFLFLALATALVSLLLSCCAVMHRYRQRRLENARLDRLISTRAAISEASARRNGLPQPVIDSFPILKFSDAEMSPEGQNTCTVCLVEYEGKDMIQKVPCGHMFHQPCVQQWLMTHTTCPVCRTSFLPEPVQVAEEGSSQGAQSHEGEDVESCPTSSSESRAQPVMMAMGGRADFEQGTVVVVVR